MTPLALEFRDVSLNYPDAGNQALNGVSFGIAPQERVALLGLNGSGKTSLLLSAVGLVPSRGVVAINGVVLSKKSVRQIREQVGFVFSTPEDQLLLPTVIEDVALGVRRRGYERTAANQLARRALERVGLVGFESRTMQRLSHGEQQRVAIAGAIVSQPSLLILDEPSAGLDPPGRRALARVLTDLGSAMLVASHDLEFTAQLCTRFVVLADGAVTYDGSDLDVATRPWQEGSAARAAT